MELMVVTKEQLADGYIELVDGVAYQRRYTKVVRMIDGTWLVIDPESDD